MRKIVLPILTVSLILLFVGAGLSQSSDDSQVSVSVDRKCSAAAYDFRFTTGTRGEDGYPLLGTGGSGYFTYLPSNLGEMAYIEENYDIYQYNVPFDGLKVRSSIISLESSEEDVKDEKINLTNQSVDIGPQYLDIVEQEIDLGNQTLVLETNESDTVNLGIEFQYLDLDGKNLSITAQAISLEDQELQYSNNDYNLTDEEIRVPAQSVADMKSLSNQQTNFSDSYLFNSTNFDADPSVSRLKDDNDTVMRAPYWYNHPYDAWDDSRPNSIEKQKEFVATSNFTDGVYQADFDLKYQCEIAPNSDSTVYDVTEDKYFDFSEFDGSDYTDTEINDSVEIDGLNVSTVDEDYSRTVEMSDERRDYFKIVSVQGNGSTPDEVSDTNEEIGRNLETDADEVSNLTKNSSLDKSVNESVNSTRETDANTTSNLSKNASLDSDAQSTEDSTPIEGSSSQPGQTPVPEPEPEPEPDPQPLISVTMRPLNSTYTTSRGRFAEVGLEVSNVGEETASNVELSPRFSEGMDWEAQSVNIDSLETNESVNESVYVRAGEGVDPGMYQIPVFASNEETDIGSQYVDVEVTENITRASSLSISEAPQDIRFEINQNYSVPVLLENAGEEDMENVQIELQNTENCGDYNASQIERIAAGETASISVDFQTSDSLQECQATIVASSDSGSFAFSEMNVETVEDKGIVPEEFRVPIIASLWTIMLIIYTVVFKRYGLDSITVKVPLIILIAGEVFILIYLSSAYYEILPPELLPFSSA